MDENLNSLTSSLQTLNRAYSDLVAHAIITIHLYEQYLLDQATSADVAKAMTDLLKTLPTEFAGTKLKKPKKALRRLPKTASLSKRPARPPRKKDV